MKYKQNQRINMRPIWLVFILLTSSLGSPLIDNSAAQSVVAAVELSCTAPYTSGSVEIEVFPGATLTGYADCTVSNPSAHTEKIAIEVTADGLATAAPGSIYLAAGDESDFQVTIRADSQMAVQSKSLTITATVQETSGLPPPNIAESSVNMMAAIMQYPGLNLEMTNPVAMIEAGSIESLQYKVYNQGNGLDQFTISTNGDIVDGMRAFSLPFTGIEVEAYEPPAIFSITVNTPADGSDWPLNADGIHTLTVDVDVIIKSQFSCEYTSECTSMSLTQKVIFFQNQTLEQKAEANELASSSDQQLLIYGGTGVTLLLLLFVFFTMRKRES